MGWATMPEHAARYHTCSHNKSPTLTCCWCCGTQGSMVGNIRPQQHQEGGRGEQADSSTCQSVDEWLTRRAGDGSCCTGGGMLWGAGRDHCVGCVYGWVAVGWRGNACAATQQPNHKVICLLGYQQYTARVSSGWMAKLKVQGIAQGAEAGVLWGVDRCRTSSLCTVGGSV